LRSSMRWNTLAVSGRAVSAADGRTGGFCAARRTPATHLTPLAARSGASCRYSCNRHAALTSGVRVSGVKPVVERGFHAFACDGKAQVGALVAQNHKVEQV